MLMELTVNCFEGEVGCEIVSSLCDSGWVGLPGGYNLVSFKQSNEA
jgi:hypothetical protein